MGACRGLREDLRATRSKAPEQWRRYTTPETYRLLFVLTAKIPLKRFEQIRQCSNSAEKEA